MKPVTFPEINRGMFLTHQNVKDDVIFVMLSPQSDEYVHELHQTVYQPLQSMVGIHVNTKTHT